VDKVLFDTSCVCGVLNRRLFPEFSRQLPGPGHPYGYRTTLYLRMEFLRRWIVTGIEIYHYARRRKCSISQAITWYEQKFSTREVKITLDWAARYIQSVLDDPPSEPVERWGWIVLEMARTYDMLLGKVSERVVTGCSRGRVQFNSSDMTLHEILSDFHERFGGTDHTCRLSEAVGSPELQPAFAMIANCDVSAYPIRSQKGLAQLRDNVRELQGKDRVLTCNDCARIGDLLIALEQPPSWILYHVDDIFDALCAAFDRRHVKVRSIAAVGRANGSDIGNG
jgi:hypothetical protein